MLDPQPNGTGEDDVLVIRGAVADAAGNPLPGALVAAIPAGGHSASATIRSAEEGTFSFSLPPGSYALTSTSTEFGGAYLPPDEVAKGGVLRLATASEQHAIRGVARNTEGQALANTLVRAEAWSSRTGDVFYVETDGQGKFLARLPSAPAYNFAVDTADYVSPDLAVPVTMSDEITIVASDRRSVEAPLPSSDVDRLREAAITLSDLAAKGFDPARLDAVIGQARVVGLGEQTHGTHEFHMFRNVLLRHLVEHHGVTFLAIEANWPESLRVNDYVLNGTGSPSEALAGLYFWIWDTEETLELIEWMRSYNADPAHTTKIKFYGYDMQYTPGAVEIVRAYLPAVDPSTAAIVDDELAVFESVDGPMKYAQLDEDGKNKVRADLTKVLDTLDRGESRYTAKSSRREWMIARHAAQSLVWAARFYVSSGGPDTAALRDQNMADNVLWLLELEGEGSRGVVYGHSAHISRKSYLGGTRTMGSHLAERLRDQYLAWTITFDRGSFRARDGKPRDVSQGVVEHTVTSAPAHYVESAFAATGHKLAVFDLRKLAPELRAWFAAPHYTRLIGAVFFSDKGPWDLIDYASHFDVALFVSETTATKPTPSGVRGPGQ